MKNWYSYPYVLAGMSILLLAASCALEQEASIPTGVSNEELPAFLSAQVTSDSNNYFQTKARIARTGNLTIFQHGWVWGESPNPTLQNNKIELGELGVDSFSCKISGLEPGKFYYLRPYVTTGTSTLFGEEHCAVLGLRFVMNTDTVIFKGAVVKFTNKTPGMYSAQWDFGDNTNSAEVSPTHTFTSLGVKKIRLSLTHNGCTVQVEKTITVEQDPFEHYWAAVPGGTFDMGCTAEHSDSCEWEWFGGDEFPVRTVTLSPFVIGKTEITQRQWKAVMGENPSGHLFCGLDCPVENVSWSWIVKRFIPALHRKTGKNYRLPTEAEWEYAARGGQTFLFAGSNDINDVGWYEGNLSLIAPHPIAQKNPNGFGLYDMTGNVWEWCHDWYDFSYSSDDLINPTGPATGEYRVQRGGSFASDSPKHLRIAYRWFEHAENRDDQSGFRLVKAN